MREQNQKNYPGQGGDIALTRDASLGISEYAPGAEVIANGRIWTSAALARYPKQFMPEEFYAACPDCHHVDTAIAYDDVPARCSHCGSTGSTGDRAPHRYLRPRGFTTSYADRSGRDPGSTRRRHRPADEARLITIPRESQYEETDHPQVRRAVLRARPDDQEAGSGRLFIVNRGPHGFGYRLCPWCFHASPANSPKAVKVKHDDPLSGTPCKFGNVLYPIDLAHEFDTDVLLLRFTVPLPVRTDTGLTPRQALESSARTVAEALRFAAAELLEIQHPELRAVYRLRGEQPEFVLYDAVAGGAGYCVRLAREKSVGELLATALTRLDCPNACASACTACLCDYSNQPLWDQLDRSAVSAWLQTLVGAGSTDPWEARGATRWNRPSLAQLDATLGIGGTLYLFGDELDAPTAEDTAALDWVLQRLIAGTRVALYLRRPPRGLTKYSTVRERQTLRHLHPWIASGTLQVAQLPAQADLAPLPRLCAGSATGAAAIFTAAPSAPLFDVLLPEPVYRHVLDEDAVATLTAVRTQSKPCPIERFTSALPIERWEFAEDEPRDFDTLFAVLAGGCIERLLIHDPYCAASSRQVKTLSDFVEALRARVASLDEIHVICRELTRNDERYRPPEAIRSDAETALQAVVPAARKVRVQVERYRGGGRRAHDRWIDAKLVGSDGVAITHRYDLSGGIDFLMAVRQATKVFRYEIES